MSHYWTGDDPIEARREQVRDWIEDLIEFGPDAVADACREWRRSQSRRPTPSDIRKLCIEVRTFHQEHSLLAAPIDMDAYARSIGWTSEAERQDAIAQQGAKYETAQKVREEMSLLPGPMKSVTRELVARQREPVPEELRAKWTALLLAEEETIHAAD